MSSYSPNQIPDSVKEKFWSRIEKRGPDECWNWIHPSLTTKGYGRFFYAGTLFAASRFALILHTGFEAGRWDFACHSCDNRLCCNPNHLRWATHAENMRDAVERGRLWGKGAREFCKRGHRLIPENIYYKKNGHRNGCKICAGMDDAIRREERRIARGARTRKLKVYGSFLADHYGYDQGWTGMGTT